MTQGEAIGASVLARLSNRVRSHLSVYCTLRLRKAMRTQTEQADLWGIAKA